MRNIILTFTLVFITACTIGGEEASEGVATIESTTRIEVVEVEKTFEEGVLDFAQCMREEGINFPDPSFDIDGNPEFDDLNIENEEEFEEAFVNCEDILREALPEQFDLDPEVEAALVDSSLEFSQCMRDEGIDFPDPKPGEFGFFAFRDADIDFESEDVQKAFEEDKNVLNEVQKGMTNKTSPHIDLPIDAGQLRFRRQLQAMINEEEQVDKQMAQ